MKPAVAPLALLLLIQLIVVVSVYRSPADNQQLATPLVSLAPALIDEIHVGDQHDNQTVLLKVGGRWLLRELEDLPANAAMVDKLLEAITDKTNIWPIANSISARQRFQVANYYYQRRLSLLSQNQVQDIVYLGTSPGFRKVHARNQAQDAIYSIKLNTFDAPGNSNGWLDRRLLQIRTPLGITADSYSLHREGNDWRSGIGKVPDERELTALLSTLRSMQVEGVAAADIQRDLAGTEADLVLTIQSLAGEVTLELFHVGEQYFIHSSEYPLFFTFRADDYQRLTGIDFRQISGE